MGQTGTSQGGQVVLLTMEAGNSSGALVRTDKDDYAPGTTVVITGRGWQPGETVKLTLHQDPMRDNDTELTAIADGSGAFYEHRLRSGGVRCRRSLRADGDRAGERADARRRRSPMRSLKA